MGLREAKKAFREPPAELVEEASRLAEMVRINLEHQHFEAAIAVIERARDLAGQGPRTDDPLQWPLSDIGLDVRTVNALDAAGVYTVGELAECKREELMALSNMGVKTVENCIAKVRAVLEDAGLVSRRSQFARIKPRSEI